MKENANIMKRKFILLLILLLMYFIFLGLIYLRILIVLQNRQTKVYLSEIAQLQANQAKQIMEKEDNWKENIVKYNTSSNIYFNITDREGNIIQKSNHPDVNQEISNIFEIKFNNKKDKENLKLNLDKRKEGTVSIAFSDNKIRKISAYSPIEDTEYFIFVFMLETKVHRQLNGFVLITAIFIVCIIISLFSFFIYTYYLKLKMNRQIEEWKEKRKLLAETTRQNVTKSVEEAINKQEFKVYIQPKVNTKTEEINGGEALIRWERNGKIINPSQFISMLEQFELISEVDEYMLKQVCQFISELKNKKIKISVNQSIQLIQKPDYIERVQKILKETKALSQLVEVEITESMLIENRKLLNERIGDLHSLGISVALDDFGSRIFLF